MVTISVPAGTSGSGSAGCGGAAQRRGRRRLRAVARLPRHRRAAILDRARRRRRVRPCRFRAGGLRSDLRAHAASSPSARIMAIGVLTATSLVPSGTRILPSVPSSTASTSMVALSVSISAMTSPDLTASPSFLSHLARLPFSMVGESAGIRTSIGMRRVTRWRPSGKPARDWSPPISPRRRPSGRRRRRRAPC